MTDIVDILNDLSSGARVFRHEKYDYPIDREEVAKLAAAEIEQLRGALAFTLPYAELHSTHPEMVEAARAALK